MAIAGSRHQSYHWLIKYRNDVEVGGGGVGDWGDEWSANYFINRGDEKRLLSELGPQFSLKKLQKE